VIETRKKRQMAIKYFANFWN